MSALIVLGLGFGDCGKGTVVARLCQDTPESAIVRFNGGAQAAHNVVSAARHHTFSQFGSGMFTEGVRTHLSHHCLLDIPALFLEADHLDKLGIPDALDRLSVSGEALVVTPYMVAANRAEEFARGKDRHGSCGRGIGTTVAYSLAYPAKSIRAGLVHFASRRPSPRAQLRALLTVQRNYVSTLYPALELPEVSEVLNELVWFSSLLHIVDDSSALNLFDREASQIIFEGAQGVLLDEHVGFHPYTTWSCTTDYNAQKLLANAGLAPAHVMGVSRTYGTRHGPGPFLAENPTYAGIDDDYNTEGVFQGPFRRGGLDLPALRYAVRMCGRVDSLAITHEDVAQKHTIDVVDEVSVPYRFDGPVTDMKGREAHTEKLLEATVSYSSHRSSAGLISGLLDIPLSMVSYGPDTNDKEVFAHRRALSGTIG